MKQIFRSLFPDHCHCHSSFSKIVLLPPCSVCISFPLMIQRYFLTILGKWPPLIYIIAVDWRPTVLEVGLLTTYLLLNVSCIPRHDVTKMASIAALWAHSWDKTVDLFFSCCEITSYPDRNPSLCWAAFTSECSRVLGTVWKCWVWRFIIRHKHSWPTNKLWTKTSVVGLAVHCVSCFCSNGVRCLNYHCIKCGLQLGGGRTIFLFFYGLYWF